MSNRRLIEIEDGLWNRVRARAIEEKRRVPEVVGEALRWYLAADPLEGSSDRSVTPQREAPKNPAMPPNAGMICSPV